MTNEKLNYYKKMFYSGAIFNVSAGMLFLFAFESLFIFVGGESVPQEPLFTLFLQVISFIILAFGGVYYVIGRNPESESSRALAILGMILKVMIATCFGAYAISGDVPVGLMGLLFVDVIYAALFFEYLHYQKVATA